MALALCLTLLPTAALAAGSEHKDHASATELKMVGDTLKKGGSDWTFTTVDSKYNCLILDGSDGGSYYLGTDLILKEGYSILISGSVTLCLNGKNIVCEKNTDDQHVISVGAYGYNNAHLTLTDCQDDAGTINGGCKASPVVNLYGGCGLDMYGGTITGSKGNGVYVDNGCTFKMSGGAITGNKGCGVNMAAGTFKMSGGAITGNSNGGVYVLNSNSTCLFYVSGDAEITGNTANGKTNNVYLCKDKYIIVAEKFTGKIGVTAADPSGTIVSTLGKEYTSGGTFISDDGKYGIDLADDGTVKLKAHNWKYTSDGSTITAKCSDCGANGGSVTIAAPNVTYNGQPKAVTLTPSDDWLGTDVKNIEIKYSKCSSKVYRPINTVPTDAGDYKAQIELGEATASVDYTIKKATLTVTAKDTTITYGNELMGNGVKYTGLVSGDENKLGGTLDYDYTYTRYGDINGSYTITPKGLTSDNYEITYAPGELTVLPREVTLEWKNTENRTVGDGKGPVTAEAGNLVNDDKIDVTIYNGALPNAAGRSTVSAMGLTGEKADNYKLPAKTTKEYEIGKAAAKVTTAPQALELTYTGEAQALVSAGAAEGGTLVYSTTENGTYEETIPTGTDADTYKVWYKVEGDGTHSSTAPVELEVTIAPKALTAAGITVAEIASTTYTGSDIEPTVMVKDGNKPLVNGTDYTVAYTDNRNAGTATVTITGEGNYTGEAKATWTIAPKELTVQSATVNSKTYTGTKNADVSEVIFDGLVPGDALTRGTDYEVKAEFDSADAADSRTATVTVTLKGTTAAKNYTLTNTGCEGSAAIRKASQTVTIPSGKSITKNGVGVDISTWASAAGVPGGSDLGELTYSLTGGAYDGVTLEGTVLTVQKETTAGSIIIKVQAAATKNYEASEEKTFTVTVTDKETVTISGLTYTGKTYDGKAIAPAGALTVEGGKVPVKELEVLYESTDGKGYSKTEAPKDAGAYKVTYKVADSNERYIGSVTYGFTISPKAVTAAPANKTMTKGSAIPAFELTYKGLVAGDTLTPSKIPEFSCFEKDNVAVSTSTAAGTYTITWTNMDGTTFDNGNYTVTPSATGTLTISNRSTGGGSSSGGSSSSVTIVKTNTVTNPDGSVTKTEIWADGTVVETTTAKDGSTSKTETKKDGSSVTESKDINGSTGTVKTDKNGQTEAKTALSNKAVEDAKKSGEAVKAPVEVQASRDSSTAPVVKVELPRNSGETTVEIPVSNAKPGTVAVLVHPDGTEEILKASVPTENGIRLTVDGNATVKIVDNSKDFVDTRNHWAREEIDFVSARELVNGISATRYAPDATATRAQLWTILARQNDTDLSGGANWYEKAQLWSKDKGISDGTNPNGTINRAQMVTMLWRAMGQPTAGGAAHFTDVPTDSYYAQAVAWAIENGITAGVGGGRFDPNATCTRAQIATFLARSMK